ncbi:hypothetical protein WA026_011510 [Henosepilachna vigintioctopunctata]|uniref:Uncharacterized protein n=1 Tax=Henosepilachna vigintioctopunctata TaxID=420089 RepID=A0AAW1TKX8_9CUCU
MDSSVMNLKIEDSKTDSSEKIEKSLSPEPPTTSKLEKEMKESDLKNIKLEKPVPTTHELEKKRKDSSEMSHEIIESSLHVEEKDGLEDKSRSPEKEKSPSKSPEQKEQEVHPLAFEDTKAIPLKDDIELKKDSSDISIDNIESRIHPEENEPEEVTKHDEKEKSSITEPSAKQILEQSTLEMKKEEEISGITTHKEQEKSPSPSLSQQKIEPLTIKDEKTDSTKDDSKIKRGEKLDSKIPYSDQSAVQEIESTLDVKKITPTSDDSSQKIEESPVCITETIGSKPLVEPTVSPDKSKLDDKEKSPIPSLEHTEKEEIEPVIADTKTIPLTEESKTIHLTEPGLHVDQNSSKLEEQKSPSPPSNQFTEETISPKTLKDTKSIHVEDSDEKNKESPKTKTEAISSKSGHEEQKVQETPENDEMKRSPSPSSEQSADQLSVESKIVSPITELPNKKEDVSVIEALASKEDREEHKTQGITEHDEDNLSASPERTLKLLSSEEKDEIIPIKDEVGMKKAECSEIAFDSKEDVESKISPEHDKKSEKETPPISEKDGDGSITPSPDKSVKEEKHSAESTLAVIDSKIEPIQKESAELLTSDSKIESVSATPDSEVEKMVSGKDDLGNIESKEEKKPQAHIEQYEVEKSLISPELTSKKEIEPEVSETKVDEELIRTTTVLETKDTPERIQDSVEDFKHEKEKPSSPSTDMLKKDTSEMPDEHSEIGGKITPSQSSVLPIKQEEKDEVESSLHKKEKEDKIPTTTDVLEKEDDSKTSPEITESKEKSKEEKFEVDSKHDEKKNCHRFLVKCLPSKT